MQGCIHDMCALDVGEFCSDRPARILQARIDLASNVADLCADVLAFTIAVRPDVEILTPAGFGLDVLGDTLFAVLNIRLDPGFEEC